ncbi:zinc ribbon domain-containing protein [Streptomyces sp. NPDC006372]|uniref:NADase-type glycan-binding domain-containing protein n=1 Tax=Streptomyces sp. NPDC006372 TaxID=3155599 RepID=UPI0033B113C3
MTTPQNCADCGTRAQPGQSFCDACGAVLGWRDRAAAAAGSSAAAGTAGTRSASEASSASGASSGSDQAGASGTDGARGTSRSSGTPISSRPDGGAGLPHTSRDRLGTAGATQAAAPRATPADPAAGTTPGQAATAPAAHRPEPDSAAPSPQSTHHPETPADNRTHPAPDDTAPTEPVPAATPTPTPDPSTTTGIHTRARRLIVPVSEPEPAPTPPPAVSPVLPGRPTPQRPQAVRAPGEEHGVDGGAPCPWCATRNRPERHFCARCAMPMAGAGPTPGRLPWWRRFGPFGSKEAPWAGDRPRLRRAFDRVLSWLAAAIVLTLLIVLAFNIPKGVQATRDHFAKRAPVSPDRYSASRHYPGHKPDLVFDKLNDTWWGPGVSESAQGQWIEARFDQPTRLLDLIITPGISTRAEDLRKSALPHRVTATVTGADGRTTTRKLTLDQGAGPQRRAFRVGEVSAVRFTIDSAYGTSAKKQVSIAEIEFFGPSSANGG